MCEAGKTREMDEKYVQHFSRKTRKETTQKLRWEGDIRMDLKEMESEILNSVLLVPDMFQWRVLVNLRVPKNAGNFLTSLATIRSVRTQFHGFSCLILRN
jgi:hypothetical protein